MSNLGPAPEKSTFSATLAPSERAFPAVAHTVSYKQHISASDAVGVKLGDGVWRWNGWGGGG